MNGIETILNAEMIKYDHDALLKVVEFSNHDMRFAINHIQAIAIGYKKITKKTIKHILSKSLKTLLQKYVKLCRQNDVDGALEYMDDLINRGYSQSDIFSTLFFIIRKCDVDDLLLAFLNTVGKYHVTMLSGTRSNIQIYALTYELCQLSIKKNENCLN